MHMIGKLRTTATLAATTAAAVVVGAGWSAPQSAAPAPELVAVVAMAEPVPVTYRAPKPASAPKPETARVAHVQQVQPQPVAQPVATYSGNWDAVAQCESGGNWQIATGNGYYGGLQFSLDTWLAYGGGQYASRPDYASRAQQIHIAEKVLAGQGAGAWPHCGSYL